MKTDLLQLRNCVEEALSRANEPGNISPKSWFLKVIKYCIFANQIIENHKIVNFRNSANDYQELKKYNNFDDLLNVFNALIIPELNLLYKSTDELLKQEKIAKLQQKK